MTRSFTAPVSHFLVSEPHINHSPFNFHLEVEQGRVRPIEAKQIISLILGYELRDREKMFVC